MTNSQKFLDAIEKTVLSKDAQAKIAEDFVNYGDAKWFDELDNVAFVSVSSWESTHIVKPEGYRNDPYSAKYWTSGNGKGYHYFLFGFDGEFEEVSEENANLYMYNAAKAVGFSEIPEFNNVEGYMIDFDTLVGSIPEHMRVVIENTKEWVDGACYATFPLKEELKRWYDREVSVILGYLTHKTKRVMVKDKDDPEKYEWVDSPITKISVGFNRFEQIPDGGSQTTSYFFVEDRSPDFNPSPSYNWHLQETSRVLYNGAIAINYRKNEETGEETVSISTHH